jgi:hypothetical protein
MLLQEERNLNCMDNNTQFRSTDYWEICITQNMKSQASLKLNIYVLLLSLDLLEEYYNLQVSFAQ